MPHFQQKKKDCLVPLKIITLPCMSTWTLWATLKAEQNFFPFIGHPNGTSNDSDFPQDSRG